MPYPRSAPTVATLALMMIGAVSTAAAAEPIPTGSASFALVDEPADSSARSAAVAPEPPPTSPPPAAAAPTWSHALGADPPPTYAPPASQWQRPADVDRGPERRVSDEWMLSLEGVTHAPVDVGFQGGVEFPFGLRVFGGYGWVPSAYLDLIVDAATTASDADPATRTVISNAFESGTAWRIQTGIRPFKKLGLYLDAGYSQIRLTGALDAADIAAVAGVPAGSVGSDTYAIESTIHMWLVELGYQAILGDRVVLGVAAGIMGTIDASTDATPSVERSPAQERALRATATEIVDQQIESYGFVPTLTLRLGFDLI